MASSVVLPEKIYEEVMDIIERGGENELRDYFVSHIDELPEGARDAVLAAFFEEALDKTGESAAAVADLQKAGLAKLEELDRAEIEADKKKKLLDLKEGI